MLQGIFKKVGLHEDGSGASYKGADILRHPKLNKSTAFSFEERKELKIQGLLPSTMETIDKQVERELHQLRKKGAPIQKYVFLMNLLDRNEKLFYKLICENIQECMPLVYTPTVGQACIEYSEIFAESRGLWINPKDSGNIHHILDNWPNKDVKVIVVTDGERILGLGDLGANGMGIPVGKLMLYSAIGGIDPACTLPVTIDVGTETESILKDPYYIGLRQKRLRGAEYDNLVLEFFQAASKKFGREVLIQFEDFGNQNAFRLLEKTRHDFCTFNDDIQGTAAVSLAGVIASLRITSKVGGGAKRLSDHVYVFHGAGEAGTGIAELIAEAINEESIRIDGKPVGMDIARSKIWLVDSKGLVHKGRPEELAHHKIPFAHEFKGTGAAPSTLAEVVKVMKPTCLIGVSAQPQQFTREICEQMCLNAPRPVIFALSNPTSKSECTAEQAYTYTNGKCLFASGSPFDPVEMAVETVDVSVLATMKTNDKGAICFNPGQGNNAYIFPGLGLGVLASKALTVPDALLLESAYALADQVTDNDLQIGCLYPPLKDIREVSTKLAARVAERAYQLNVATLKPKPADLLAHCRSMQFHNTYE